MTTRREVLQRVWPESLAPGFLLIDTDHSDVVRIKSAKSAAQ
jgi:hypothetical protein